MNRYFSTFIFPPSPPHQYIDALSSEKYRILTRLICRKASEQLGPFPSSTITQRYDKEGNIRRPGDTPRRLVVAASAWHRIEPLRDEIRLASRFYEIGTNSQQYVCIHIHTRKICVAALVGNRLLSPTVRRCRLPPPVFPPSLTSDLIKPWQVRICLCSGNKSSTIAARHTGHLVNELNTR